MAAAFIDGAREQGADVVDYGMMATDMMYFAVARDGHDGGVQITASHNPKEYNGIKMVRQEAFPLSGEAGIGDIRDMIAGTARCRRRRDARAASSSANVLDDYVKHVMSFIDPVDHQAVQRRRSTPAAAWPAWSRRSCSSGCPAAMTPLCFDIDGTFPNHEANPLIEENRRDITERVIAEKADIGIAWDGDADRCFFIDGTGEFIAGDFVTALLAEAFLLKHPGAKIVYDVRASYAVKDIVAKYGGTALMNRVGHAFFKRRMREENAIFGGEVTGHYYFRDNFYADNGFIPALLILELMSQEGPDAAPSCCSRCARSTSSPARSTPRSATCRSCQEKLDGLAGQVHRRRHVHAGRVLGRVPGLALQRARLEHRADAPAEPRSDDAAG